MKRTIPTPPNACVMGKEKYSPANVTCISCRKQGVACPFPCAVPESPVKNNPPRAGKKEGPGKQPNKTESAYGRRLEMEYPGSRVRYEAITFTLDNGHRYTPDWIVFHPDGKILCVEVKAKGKNGFRHPSYQRARCMFDQCRVELPMFAWRWADRCGANWDVADY